MEKLGNKSRSGVPTELSCPTARSGTAGSWQLPGSCRPPLLQGKKKVLENWQGHPSLGPGLPHRPSATLPIWVIFPAHPIPLSFAGVQRHAKAAWARLQASLGLISSLRQELGVRTACQEQQQLHPLFSGNSQVISKPALRDQGQEPKNAPNLMKTLPRSLTRRNHQVSHHSNSQSPFKYINHMGRMHCASIVP